MNKSCIYYLKIVEYLQLIRTYTYVNTYKSPITRPLHRPKVRRFLRLTRSRPRRIPPLKQRHHLRSLPNPPLPQNPEIHLENTPHINRRLVILLINVVTHQVSVPPTGDQRHIIRVLNRIESPTELLQLLAELTTGLGALGLWRADRGERTARKQVDAVHLGEARQLGLDRSGEGGNNEDALPPEGVGPWISATSNIMKNIKRKRPEERLFFVSLSHDIVGFTDMRIVCAPQLPAPNHLSIVQCAHIHVRIACDRVHTGDVDTRIVLHGCLCAIEIGPDVRVHASSLFTDAPKHRKVVLDARNARNDEPLVASEFLGDVVVKEEIVFEADFTELFGARSQLHKIDTHGRRHLVRGIPKGHQEAERDWQHASFGRIRLSCLRCVYMVCANRRGVVDHYVPEHRQEVDQFVVATRPTEREIKHGLILLCDSKVGVNNPRVLTVKTRSEQFGRASLFEVYGSNGSSPRILESQQSQRGLSRGQRGCPQALNRAVHKNITVRKNKEATSYVCASIRKHVAKGEAPPQHGLT